MDPVELRMHRLNTKAFIDVKPTEIVLQPVMMRERTASGGYRDIDAPPRLPQTFRIIELGQTVVDPRVKTQDGRDREISFWLLGTWDAQVAIDDSWREGDRLWEIADVIRDNHYETRAVVSEHGR